MRVLLVRTSPRVGYALLVVLLVSIKLAAAAQGGSPTFSQPSFDCAKARSPLALLICSGEETARADWDLRIASWAQYFLLSEPDRASFWEDQDKWLSSLNQKCQLTNSLPFSRQQTSCVIGAYKARAALYRSRLTGEALAESKLSPEQLAKAQQTLIALGFLKGEADGEFGPVTRAAIRKYQEANGLPQSDYLSTEQRQALLEGRAVRGVVQSDASDPSQRTVAGEKHWFENFVDGRGGCGNIHLLSTHWARINVQRGSIDDNLFGKPLLQWSDDDIAAAVRIYKRCQEKRHAAIVDACIRGTGQRTPFWRRGEVGRAGDIRSDCERKNPVPPFVLQQIRDFEAGLRNIILDARNLDNQRKAQQAARIELEKAEAQRKGEQAEEQAQRRQEQLREQAKRDKEAAEEARQLAEREEPKIAEATREAEEARRARQAAEQRLAEIRSQIEAAEKEKREALSQSQAAEPKRRQELSGERFSFKADEFGRAYNRMASRLAMNQERMSLRECTGGADYACQYQLSSAVGGIVASKTASDNAHYIWLMMGSSKNAGMAALSMLGAITTVIATLNPEFTPEQRGKVLRPLLLDSADRGGNIEGEAWVGTTHYKLKTVEGLGLWLTIEASVPNETKK
jgi:hypothetical protein